LWVLCFDRRTPDEVISNLRIDLPEPHATAEIHTEVGGAALADDVLYRHKAARGAVVPPGIAVPRHEPDARRRHLDRAIVHARAHESVGTDPAFRPLEDDVGGPVLHVHVRGE